MGAISLENRAKIKWQVILFLAIVSYILAFATQLYFFNFVAIGLAICVYKYGNSVLFKEYHEQKRKKYEEAMKVREAVQTILKNKKA